MKRPWYFWGLLMFLYSFSKMTGMEIVFIPLFLLLFLLFPLKYSLFFILILLRLAVPLPELSPQEGLCELRRLSPVNQDMVVNFQGQRYLLKNFDGLEGTYAGSFIPEEFSSKRSPSGFCERDYYFSQGFRGYAARWEGELRSPRPFFLTRIREELFRRAKVFGEYRGLAYSLVFGLKEGLSPDEKSLFSRIGLMHLFVVSGLHLGIYYRGCLGFVKAIGMPRWLGESLGLVLVFFFCYLSDFHVSSLRTLLLLIVEVFAFHFKKKADPFEAMGGVCLLLLFFRPSYATNFSFILGTLSYGLLRGTRKRPLLTMYLLMFPLQLLFNSQIKGIYFLANTLIASLMGLVLPFVMLGFFIPFIAKLSAYFFIGLMGFLESLQILPWFWHIPPPGWLCLFIFYLMIFSLVLARENKRDYLFTDSWKRKGACLFMLLILFQVENNYRREGVHFFDVGQGDSSLLITQSGKSLLIDTGRGKAIHDHLHSLGILRVDVIIISHFDDDHAKELEKLAYGRLYHPKGSDYPGGIPLEAGDHMELDGVHLHFLSPAELFGENNEDSLVFILDTGSRKILYTGDVGMRRLSTMPRVKADLLKFPHHGSRNSLDREYFDALDPEMVILSYGKNRYGHPNKEVLDYLQARFAIFETQKSGSFHLKHKGYRSY